MRNTVLLAIVVLVGPYLVPVAAYCQLADVIEAEPDGPAQLPAAEVDQAVQIAVQQVVQAAQTEQAKEAAQKEGPPEKKEAEPEAPAETPEPARPPVHPQMIRLHLMDGSVISGKLSIKEILVDTEFGQLNVPIENIRIFTPGLGSHPELTGRIDSLIDDLGSSEYGDRERAQKELQKIGLPALELLQKRQDDTDTERRKRIKTLLTELEDIQDALEDEFAEEPEMDRSLMIQRDTVVTTEFTMVGKIVPKSFNISSPYGSLVIKLSDIRRAVRDSGGRPDVKKSFGLDGSYIVQRGSLDTKIRVERGDRVYLEADGTLTMTPWGNRAIATPEGAPNYGWYIPNDIPSGALIAKIGKGNFFKVGSKHNFTVEKTGDLELAIGMQQDYSNNNFPGRYNVKILVKRKQP